MVASERPTAIVAGHLCLDIIPDLRQVARFDVLFTPGRLVEVGTAAMATGGAVSNTGLALHKLGIATSLMAKVGDDAFGGVVRSLIAERDPCLASGLRVDAHKGSSYTIIINPPGLDRRFLHYPGANDSFGAGDVDEDRVAKAQLFHLGYPPLMRRLYENGGSELAEIVRRAHATGATVSLDLAFPDSSSDAGRVDWAQILRTVLPHVDVFLPSVEELVWMVRRETYADLAARSKGGDILPQVTPDLLSDVAHQMLAWGARVVVLKLGDRGLYAHTGSRAALEAMGRARPADVGAWAGRELWAPCFAVGVAGTTGAGDATIAGFLAALLRGTGLEEAVTIALAVGACSVEAVDAQSGILTWDETLARIHAGWARRSLVLNDSGWRWDVEHQLRRRVG